ncbi:aspartate/glutamate racemase family protein (plasmid) [Thioclava sp. 'Guangxiensis']|uniref:maleate cis-trans isomerase family protein n=1 Tax=Thioclava sp. 'Guangxiensis' TaxID=3149044 RepID=UPI003877B016
MGGGHHACACVLDDAIPQTLKFRVLRTLVCFQENVMSYVSDCLTARPLSTYSTEGRIGLIVPPTNTVNEAEWARLMPEGVTSHSFRMKLHPDAGAPDRAAELEKDLLASIDMLLPMKPDVVAYACTAGSMVTPSSDLPQKISETCGTQVVTTADSIVQALRALGAAKVTAVTPYDDLRNAHEVSFLRDHGIETLSISGFGLGKNGPSDFPKIAQLSTADILVRAREVIHAESEAIVLTCTDFPTLPLIEELETAFGIPVLSSNTATLWGCLRHTPWSGSIAGAGRLLRDMPGRL